MRISSRHRNCRSIRTEVDRCDQRTFIHSERGATSVGVAPPIAQLTVVIRSPTRQVAVVKDGADMGIICRHRDDRLARAATDHRSWSQTVRTSPTLQDTVVEDDAGVGTPSRHRNGRSAWAEVDRCG